MKTRQGIAMTAEVVIKDSWVTRFSVKDGVLTSTENGQRFVKAAQ